MTPGRKPRPTTPPTGLPWRCDREDEALAELRRAVAADSRFAIWPTTKYQVERILGAGAFGVAFLCHHRYKDRHVVIKTFEAAGIDRDVTTIFREAQILDRLEHPGIVRLLDCGFADEDRQRRPYLEIDTFLRQPHLGRPCQSTWSADPRRPTAGRRSDGGSPPGGP